jgi:hypothetical protein
MALTQVQGGMISSLPAGSVLQVVTGSLNTNISTSLSTYVDSGLTATITPKFNTSKILILVNGLGYKTAGNSASALSQNLVRNGSQITEWNILSLYTGTALNLTGNYALNYIDSPASTSALTYKVQFKNDVLASAVYMSLNNTPSVITLLEIAA